MASLKEVEKKVEFYVGMKRVVLSMKSIASSNLTRAQDTLKTLREFDSAVLDAISFIKGIFPELSFRPEKGSRLVILFGSDHGLCGKFNEHLLSTALGRFDSEEDRFLAIGRRLALLLGGKAEFFPAPGHFESIHPRATELIERITPYFEEGLPEIYAVFNEFRGIGKYRTSVITLFPIEAGVKRRFGVKPLIDLPPEEILSRLITEYLFSRIYRCYLESFISENGVRLVNMEGASSSIDENLKRLQVERNYLRQEEVTSEILEVMSAYRLMV